MKAIESMSPDDTIFKALFLQEGRYVLVCATTRKCTIVDYTVDNNINDRLIINGFSKIGDVFLITDKKFFGITNP
jgi:hypothetical protein